MKCPWIPEGMGDVARLPSVPWDRRPRGALRRGGGTGADASVQGEEGACVCVCVRECTCVCAHLCARACACLLKCARTYLHAGVHVARIRMCTRTCACLSICNLPKGLSAPSPKSEGAKKGTRVRWVSFARAHPHTCTRTLVPPNARGHPQGRPGCWDIIRVPVVGSGWRCPPPPCQPHLGGWSRLGAMGCWPVPQFGDPVAPAAGPQGQDLR